MECDCSDCPDSIINIVLYLVGGVHPCWFLLSDLIFLKVCVMWMHVNACMHVCVHVYTCTHMHKIPVRNHPPPLCMVSQSNPDLAAVVRLHSQIVLRDLLPLLSESWIIGRLPCPLDMYMSSRNPNSGPLSHLHNSIFRMFRVKGLFYYLFVCTSLRMRTHMHGGAQDQKRVSHPWSWSYRCCESPSVGAASELMFSVRSTNALCHWALFLAPSFRICNFFIIIWYIYMRNQCICQVWASPLLQAERSVLMLI